MIQPTHLYGAKSRIVYHSLVNGADERINRQTSTSNHEWIRRCLDVPGLRACWCHRFCQNTVDVERPFRSGRLSIIVDERQVSQYVQRNWLGSAPCPCSRGGGLNSDLEDAVVNAHLVAGLLVHNSSRCSGRCRIYPRRHCYLVPVYANTTRIRCRRVAVARPIESCSEARCCLTDSRQ